MTSRPERAVCGVVLALTLWHLVVGATSGLGDAEALYYAYSLHPAGGYLDHPPLIGWLIALATHLFGHTPSAVRMVSLASHLATVVGIYALGCASGGSPTAGWRAVLALLLVPLMTIGGLAAAPDGPASALWVWTVLGLHRVFFRSEAERARLGWGRRLAEAIGLGALMGATFLAKYTGVLLVLSALVVLSHPRHRALARGPWLPAAAAACLTVVWPVIAWNQSHGWASIWHRLVWTQQGAGLSLATLGTTLGGQLVSLGPPMAVLLGGALIMSWRRRSAPQIFFLLVFSALPLAFTWGLCLLSPAAEPHWPAQGYLTLSVALGVSTVDDRLSPRGLGWGWRAAVAWLALVLVLLHLAVWTTVLPDLLGPRRYEPRYDVTNELHGWPLVGERVASLRRPDEPVAANHYTICSQLVLALASVNGPGRVPVRCLSPEQDDFDYWGEGSVEEYPSLLYVEDSRFGRPVQEVFPQGEKVELGSVVLRRRRWKVREFRLFRVWQR